MNISRAPAIELFQSEVFRESPFVRDLCAQLGEVFVTRDTPPRGHFTAYLRVVTVRGEAQQPNPVLRDLYTLHELWHLGNAYPGEPAWLDWVRRRVASEFEASLVSECLVYFHIPELRPLTFDHEIWVDRFLHLRARPMFAIEQALAEERRRALNAPRHDDFIEFQIHGYAAQNMQWCRVWAEPVGFGADAELPAFRAVERHVGRQGWERDHPDWLHAHSEVGVPFPRQAEAFAVVYDATMRSWGNQYLRR